MATLSGLFGFLAVLLATIGLYGVIAYMVTRRRNEIGIRMALGADGRSVVAMIMREAAILLAIGLAAGLILASAAATAARALLFGLRPRDPVTFIMATAILAVVALTASYLPSTSRRRFGSDVCSERRIIALGMHRVVRPISSIRPFLLPRSPQSAPLGGNGHVIEERVPR